MELLQTPPLALTRSQRILVLATTVAVAVTRIWARSLTLWDWDEALFAMSLHDFDVPQHHPHPPGFPFYVLLGKIARTFIGSDFRALQAVVIVAAISLFPLLFLLARELRFTFATAWSGALLFVFFPNVWFFGGTAFSDVPGLALALAACAMLLRGCRETRAYLAGAVLLGLAAAVRPQALVIAFVPSLLSMWCRSRKSWSVALAAPLIGGLIVFGSYAGAALASESVESYLGTARALREYVRKVDSFLNPERQPLSGLLDDFFVDAIPGGRASVVVAVAAAFGALASLFRRAPRVWLLLAMFLPFNLMGWLLLDVNSISRYSVSFGAMYALLAAEGIAILCSIARTAAPLLQSIVVMAIALRYSWWAAPAIGEVRRIPSPPHAAMTWLLENTPATATLYAHGSVGPYVSYYLGKRNVIWLESPEEIPSRAGGRDEYFVTEGLSSGGGAQNFVRPRERIYDIARKRYFSVSAIPVSGVARFGSGWYWEEEDGKSTWRWMAGRGEISLQPVAGKATLTIEFSLPTEVVPRRPVIEVTLNGHMVERFVCATPSVRKEWTVDALADRRNELVITTDKPLNPAREKINADERDLGLQLFAYSWRPVS
ncbi:MAG: hypothetical protein JJE51_09275 [Thermoanaerobaculia bacterium]|nr:hypothetical protein [Thermoanaerobaculia bacterium]